MNQNENEFCKETKTLEMILECCENYKENICLVCLNRNSDNICTEINSCQFELIVDGDQSCCKFKEF